MTDDRPPERVRVSGPPRRRTGRAQPRRRHIDAETRLGEIYLGSLLREQLRLAALSLLVLLLGLGTLPALFWWQPGLAEVRLLGIPLPWLLIGFAAYPFLLLVGWRYVRAAERNEDDFTDLVETMDP
ncbi:hypothetical protein [Nocardioides euryhalodurans]|uniref:DUF485 domain-containing protein n=1 Tax=Nocardioides euryhalodurans TaxID=2518370 RepID=A0A4P7GKM6_9ACTN|nr:hypothetical protein [Nocardioides euryhalodurans]QBR92620.1 hypothetical protein EXE57_10285 [Nocardioides euryhalodurans]